MQAGSHSNAYLIDTNQFQGTENWSQIAQAKIHGTFPVQGAIIRASEGTSADTAVHAAAIGATDNHLYRGFYHAIVPSGTSAAAITRSAHDQAQFFYQTVQAENGWEGRCINPGVDIEINPGSLSSTDYTKWVEEFLTELETSLGSFPLKPMLYLNETSWTSLLGKTTQFSGYPLWVASWGVSQPVDMGPWTHWTAWQYSQPGKLAGVPQQTDFDEWHSGTLPAPVPSNTVTSALSALNHQVQALQSDVGALKKSLSSAGHAFLT